MKKSKASYWTRVAKTDEEKTQLKLDMAAARPVLEKLSKYIDECIASTDIDDEDLTTSHWQERCASNIGARKALKKVKFLIDNSNI